MFAPPPETKHNFLSLGAGVQSSCLALMAAKGEVGPMPDAAIFADTQAEPASVYEWLDWLEKQLPFPVVRVVHGDLEADALEIKTSSDNKKYMKVDIPFFLRNLQGEKSMMRNRGCTRDYKVIPVDKAVGRLTGRKRGSREVAANVWVGISLDEVIRMKPSRRAWIRNVWPLIDKRMSRHDCLRWMENNGYPLPPRSACYFCPYHSNKEWKRLRDDEPGEFAKAIAFDRRLREQKKLVMEDPNRSATRVIEKTPFLHSSCVPLSEVDFDDDLDRGQESLFGNECEGMCGV